MQYLAGFLGICLILTGGCPDRDRGQASRPAPTENGNPESLVYWCAPNVDEIALARELVDKWNRLHPETPVLLQPIPASRSSEEVIFAAVAGKTTPDICSNIFPPVVQELVAAGGVVNLAQFPDFAAFTRQRVPAEVLEKYRMPDGGIYQMPWKTCPVMLAWNTRYFAAAGIDHPPRTYSEFLADAARLAADTDGDGQIDRWMCYLPVQPVWWYRMMDFYPLYLAASGGQNILEQGRCAIDNAAGLAVMQLLQEMYRRGYMPRTTFQSDAFAAGRTAVTIVGSWYIATAERIKAAGVEYDFAPLPVPDNHTGPVSTLGDIKNITIFSTCKQPQAAWEFVKFLTSSESDLRLMAVASEIPLRKDMEKDPAFRDFFAQNPKLARFAAQVPFAREIDLDVNLKEILDTLSQEYEACVIYQAKTPREALQAAVRRTDVILQWNQQ